MHTVALGATAVGTGLGAPQGYRAIAVRELASVTGHDLEPAPDLFDALANLDPYAAIADAGARAALTMAKIAADIRLLSSRPAGGCGDLTIPAVQAGSSIMPAKVNPAISEYVMQLSYRIRGAAHTVECAVAAGELELNIIEPVIVDSIITFLADITAAATSFAQRCVAGITWGRPAPRGEPARRPRHLGHPVRHHRLRSHHHPLPRPHPARPPLQRSPP